jgi:hypothetical protein
LSRDPLSSLAIASLPTKFREFQDIWSNSKATDRKAAKAASCRVWSWMGRVGWNGFGAMLMAFEGWRFRIELVDPGEA